MASGRIGPILAVIGSDIKGFTDGLTKSQKALQTFSATAAIAGVRASAAFAATFGAIGAFALKVGSEFELAMANVKKTVEGTPEEFEKLEASIRSNSVTFGIAASELANLARIGGQLGIATEDLDGFTSSMAKLSIAAAELDPETAAKAIARLSALTGETGAAAFEKMANVVAKLGDTLPTTEGRILDFAGRLASFGSAVGLTSEQILGLSAGFSALVGGTERAATSIERFLGEMATAVAEQGPELEAFADLASKALNSPIKSIEDFTKAFSEEPIKAIELVIGGMETLGKDGLAPLLLKFDELGISGVRMLSTFAAGAKGADKLRLALATAAKEAEEQTKLQKELAIQLDTVARQFDVLKAQIVNVGIELFQAFRDEIMFLINVGKVFVQGMLLMAKTIKALGPIVQLSILAIAGLAGGLSILLVVLGTLGGLAVGVSALFGTMAAALSGTTIAAQLAAAGYLTFSASTGTASIATGAFTLALGGLKAMFFQTILPMMGVVAAGVLLAKGFGALSTATTDLAPSTEKAIAELGFFGKIIQSFNILVLDSIAAIKQWIAAKSDAADASKDLADETGKAAEEQKSFGQSALGVAGAALRLFTGVTQVTFAYSKLREAARSAEENQRILANEVTRSAVAAFIAARDNITLEEAIKKMAKSSQEAQDRVRALAQANEQLAEAGGLVKKQINDQIDSFLKGKEEAEKFDAVMKGLGVTEQQLKALVEINEKGFLDLALAQIKAREAADELTESTNKQAEAFANLGVDAAVDQLNLLGAALNQALSGGADFSPDALIGIFTDLADQAKAAGKEIGPDLIGNLLEGLDTSFVQTGAQAREFIDGMRAVAKEAGLVFSEELFQSIQPEIFAQAVVATGEEVGRALQEAADKAKLVQEEFDKSAKASQLLGQAFADTKEGAAAFEVAQDKLNRASAITGKEITNVALAEAILDSQQTKVTTGTEALRRGEELLANGFNKATSAVEIATGISGEYEDATKQAGEETKRMEEAVKALSAVMDILGISSDSALGKIVGGFQAASLAAAKVAESRAKLSEATAEGGPGLLSKEGINAGIEFGTSMLQGAVSVWEAGAGGGIAGAIGGAVAGAQFGAEIGGMFGPIGEVAGAAIGAGIGLALSLFRGKPEFKKIMEETGRDWGVDISEELAKEIEATAERLDIGRFEARLLSLGNIIGEAGGIAKFGMEQATVAVGDLFNAVAMGVVPAEEGIKEIGEVFGQMADEIFEAGTLADSGMLAIIERSRQLGIEIPEITAFITEQLAQAADGIAKIIGSLTETEGGEEIFGGIQVASVEDAQAQATIFAAGFFATLKEQGLLAAVDAFEPAFGEMKKKFEQFGGDVNFGGIQKFFDIAQNPEFRPLLEGLGGLTEAMTGLGNAGFLTKDTFAAFQQQGGAAFAQLQEAGLGVNESLQQMAPFLQEAINASQQFGFTLDEDTQKMIEQAEAAGIAFKTDPMMQMVDVLKLIAAELGVLPEKLAGVGTAAQESANTTATAYEESSVRSGEAFDGMAMRGEGAYDRLAQAGVQAAQETSAASKSASDDTVEAATVATDQTKVMWAEAKEFVGTEFEGMKENILGNYETIIESTIGAGAAVTSLGETAFNSVAGFDAMAAAAARAEAAARGANSAASGGGGGGGGGGPPNRGQFGLTATVNEPTTFLAGEAGEETVTIDPGGDSGGGGGPGVIVLQIDGKTIGKVLGDLSRTGDVRIHPSAVKDFG